MSGYHEPVLLSESIDFLVTNLSGRYVDATFGGGGHTTGLLSRLNPDAVVVALDVDDNAARNAEKLRASDKRFSFSRENFSLLDKVLASRHLTQVDGVLFDLGVSSYQIDKEEGFSYRRDERLDMRLDDRLAVSAYEVVNSYDVADLARVFIDYGEERRGRALASAIVRERRITKIETTSQFSALISRVCGKNPKVLSRIFQAVRIEVNKELEALSMGLDAAVGSLSRGGRIVVISYHSLEDRIVKEKFRFEAASCICPPGAIVCTCGKTPRLKIITRKPVAPGRNEVNNNRRSRSAKMRVAGKI